MVDSLEKRWTPVLGLERSWYLLVFMVKEVLGEVNVRKWVVGSGN